MCVCVCVCVCVVVVVVCVSSCVVLCVCVGWVFCVVCEVLRLSVVCAVCGCLVCMHVFCVCWTWVGCGNNYNAARPLTCTHTLSIAFRHPPPNSARFSYATEGVLFISAQLTNDAVSALRKIWVLIRLWKQPSAQACM